MQQLGRKMQMNHILLLIGHQKNRQLLAGALAEGYRVTAPDVEAELAIAREKILKEDFDLCFIDQTAVRHLRQTILARREAAIPLFLPFVFLTTMQEIGISTDHLEPLIDDIIHVPIEKIELKTKIRVLLRSRLYSLQLQAAKEKLNHSLMQEKESNQIKSGFISKVSHEFRNPLNSISGMAQILETYGEKLTPEKKAEVLQQLRRNVIKMSDLLDEVLLIGQKEMGKLQFNPTSIQLEKFCRGVINEVQTAFDRQQKIDFSYRAEPEYNLDSKLLDYILTNLLANACKYSPQDSVIDFEIHVETSELIFIIRDRGIGIPTEDIPHLFDSFYRASNSRGYQGTGLGLTIVKEYVEFCRGTISVISELEVGTTFSVKIPLGEG